MFYDWGNGYVKNSLFESNDATQDWCVKQLYKYNSAGHEGGGL